MSFKVKICCIPIYSSILCLFLSSIFSKLYCYNIEVNKVGKFQGDIDSQFGYSVAIVRAPGWTNNPTADFHPKFILVGAPNTTFEGIKGHGQVAACTDTTDLNLNCQSLNLTDISDKCARLKPRETHCFQDARLGHTLEVNRKFADVYQTNYTLPMVSVCAPSWKNVYPESTSLQNHMVGLCLKLRDDLRPINCGIPSRSYCWPFWAESTTTTSQTGRPIYTYAQGGFSATFTQDGLSEVVGGPGADDWRGAYIAFQKSWTKRLENQPEHTIYFAYSLTTGKFGENLSDIIVSGVPNYYILQKEGYYGKVEIFNAIDKKASLEFGTLLKSSGCADLPLEELMQDIDVKQIGTKFGATVATVDLTGDGWDEILVGAPLYTHKRPEEGRVFVYTFRNNAPCGPVGVFSGAAANVALGGKSAFARFGSAISSVGDLDQDGFDDVAIGAPYEDNDQGAVYIYPGKASCDCIIQDVFSQRIAGKDVDPGIRSFGWSLYGDEDVDNNLLPDLAVGSFQSNKVMLFRTRPIVTVDVQMLIEPNPIPLDASLLKCSKTGDQLCFNMSILFQYRSVGSKSGGRNETMIQWSLDADTLYKSQEGNSRVEFRRFPGQSFISQNITLRENNSHTENYIVDVKKYRGKSEPPDAWTNVRINGSYKIVQLHENDFKLLDPVLHKNTTPISKDVQFDKTCDSIENCTSDLEVKVEMLLLASNGRVKKVEDDTVIYVDDFSEMEITVDVRNVLNTSYQANVSGEVTAFMRRDVSSNNGAVSATCTNGQRLLSPTNITCVADSKLDLNENIKLKSYFDLSSYSLVPDLDIDKMKSNISVDFRADQASYDVNMSNNRVTKHIDIQLKYAISIKENTDYDQLRYKADETGVSLKVIHKYIITNEGPSFLPRTIVNLSIPVQFSGAELAIIKNTPSTCVKRASQAVQSTTLKPTTAGATTAGVDAERRRRRNILQTTVSPTDQDNVYDSNLMKITCENAKCEILECSIEQLKRYQQETIEIEISIHQTEIAKIKNFQEIRYRTTAVVTDPSVWFEGKVVPFDKTLDAEKWTSFVIESSAVTNVSIWLIIGSVIGAVAVLAIIVTILWKCGFFKRHKHNEVQEWKRSSMFARQSVRLSTLREMIESSDSQDVDKESNFENCRTEDKEQAHEYMSIDDKNKVSQNTRREELGTGLTNMKRKENPKGLSYIRMEDVDLQ